MRNRDYDDPDFFSDEILEAIAEPAAPSDWAPGPNEDPGDAGPSAQGLSPIVTDQQQGQPAASDASLDAMAEKIAALALQKIEQRLGGSDA